MSYLHSLSVFLTVAEEGSFSAAGKRLGLTQPTVSFHIDNLEKHFGCSLFMRTAKGVGLTVYGKILYENTHKLNSLLDDTANQLKTLAAGHAGHIRIGASTIPGEYILPPVIAGFLRINPGVKISLEIGDSDTILNQFEHGCFAFAVIGIKPDGHHNCTPLWRDEVVAVVSPDFDLPQDITPGILFALPLIMRKASSGTRKTLLKFLAGHGVEGQKLNVVLEVNGNEALKSAVLSGLGVGFVSRWAVWDELERGRLRSIDLPEIRIERPFYALSGLLTDPPCVKKFWDYMLASAAAERRP